MSKEITFLDITGNFVSGRFEVSEGPVTVTLSDGRKTTQTSKRACSARRS